jgi:hypothetical protein
MKIRVRNDGGCGLDETVWEGELEHDVVLEIHIDDGVLELWNESDVLTVMPKETRRLRVPRRIGYWETPDMVVSMGLPAQITLRYDMPKEVP